MTRVPLQAPRLSIHPVPNGYVVRHLDTGTVHHLNATAAMLLELCQGQTTEREIAGLVQRAYRLDAEALHVVSAGLDGLARRGLIVWPEAARSKRATFGSPFSAQGQGGVIADDMEPVVDGYDEEIANDMARYFPGLDGAILYDDGLQRPARGVMPPMTLPVLGRKLYESWGYVYHPSCVSEWCDNETTDVALRSDKLHRAHKLIIEHRWVGTYHRDTLHERNSTFHDRDKANYERRRAAGFPSDERIRPSRGGPRRRDSRGRKLVQPQREVV